MKDKDYRKLGKNFKLQEYQPALPFLKQPSIQPWPCSIPTEGKENKKKMQGISSAIFSFGR